ncbi:CRISPR/Cas system-associated exonuclease Cas4 (RecB family) [Sphingomonas zeicaulis]|uniref:hypothetical protein n=1 Tax=Sphingomonas zeicaulis TaxID=1632740 RepID=UPI003D20DDBA
MSGAAVAIENVETVAVSTAPAIGMPDHPVRLARWYQLYVRLARPSLEWVTVAGVLYALVIGPAIGRPLDEGYLVQVLLFAGGLFGVRAYEKVKGVA